MDEWPDDDGSEACVTCAERGLDECPQSRRACGHHSNEWWDHDACWWCGLEVEMEDRVGP